MAISFTGSHSNPDYIAQIININMNKIIAIAFISCCQAVFTLNWSNVCSCSNVYTQMDCEIAACTWSNNSCSKSTCSTFTTEATCVGGCFWSSGSC